MHKKKAGKLQTGNTFPKQYWLAVNGKPKSVVHFSRCVACPMLSNLLVSNLNIISIKNISYYLK